MPVSRMPVRISRLEELAYNLWWSWHLEARQLFRMLDYQLWRTSGHNPVKELQMVSQERLEEAANDPSFLRLYDITMSDFDADILSQRNWFHHNYSGQLPGPVAYFSAEFAIHNSLPIYAGGLGVLAGDLCKEASDLGLPLVGVGFMYPQGYFHQHISPEGWQEENYEQLNFSEAPVEPVTSANGKKFIVPVNLGNRTVFVDVWRVHVGNVDLYLLDTNINENESYDRQLSARLYIADREQRIQQEIILGVGGVHVLQELGIKPSVWHANEGHTAFMMLERVREELKQGISLPEAVRRVQETSVFTTHTPVPAGHDVFPIPWVEKYLCNYCNSLGIDQNELLKLGIYGDGFNMTALGLRVASYRNAVSRLHGTVTRRMWHVLWPELKEDEVPVSHITNGVHMPTWVAPELDELYRKYIGSDWLERCDDASLMQRVRGIPDDVFWQVRQTLKNNLVRVILARAQQKWSEGGALAPQVLAMGALLDNNALSIGFVRRFAEYKRPALIFQDIERLKRIVKNSWKPVQIVFAGKSHPADFPSKYLLHQVYSRALEREFQGRIAFIEDYDMHMARYLVQGVDVWLNNPRRLQEASGTSGMKAAVNGVLHCSVRDGWWAEGYNGRNGWVIGPETKTTDPNQEDKEDASALYQLLEDELVPLYYDRDLNNIPRGWMQMVKESVSSLVPQFSGRRMLKEYTEQMYLPAAQSLKEKVR